jgi:hypothetical protein
MPNIANTGTILVRTGTAVPGTLSIDSQPYAPGWRLVTNLDGSALGRQIHAEQWTFFCIAGETRAIAFGTNREKALPKAIRRLLARQKMEFNSLEITRVELRSFFGLLPYVSVSARSRHIQANIYLVPVTDVQEQGERREWSGVPSHTLWEETTTQLGGAKTDTPQWFEGVGK